MSPLMEFYDCAAGFLVGGAKDFCARCNGRRRSVGGAPVSPSPAPERCPPHWCSLEDNDHEGPCLCRCGATLSSFTAKWEPPTPAAPPPSVLQTWSCSLCNSAGAGSFTCTRNGPCAAVMAGPYNLRQPPESPTPAPLGQFSCCRGGHRHESCCDGPDEPESPAPSPDTPPSKCCLLIGAPTKYDDEDRCSDCPSQREASPPPTLECARPHSISEWKCRLPAGHQGPHLHYGPERSRCVSCGQPSDWSSSPASSEPTVSASEPSDATVTDADVAKIRAGCERILADLTARGFADDDRARLLKTFDALASSLSEARRELGEVRAAEQAAFLELAKRNDEVGVLREIIRDVDAALAPVRLDHSTVPNAIAVAQALEAATSRFASLSREVEQLQADRKALIEGTVFKSTLAANRAGPARWFFQPWTADGQPELARSYATPDEALSAYREILSRTPPQEEAT